MALFMDMYLGLFNGLKVNKKKSAQWDLFWMQGGRLIMKRD